MMKKNAEKAALILAMILMVNLGRASAGEAMTSSASPDKTPAAQAGPPAPATNASPVAAPEPASAIGEGATGGDGKWPVELSATIEGLYDDNIFIRSNHEVGDFIWTITPGIKYESGVLQDLPENYFKLSYTPSVILFQDESSNDAIDQDATVAYYHHFEKLTVGVEQVYRKLSGNSPDLGGRLHRSIYDTKVTGTYEVSDKTSVEADLMQKVRDFLTQPDTTGWAGELWVDYQLFPKTKIGFGPAVGFLDIDSQPNQTYQQALTRAVYEYSEKLSFTARAGMELREFQGSVVGDRITPVFSLGAIYKPTDATMISLEAFRTVENSPILVQRNYNDTGVRIYARQRFFQKYYLAFAGGYEISDYYGTGPGGFSGLGSRHDDYYYVRPSFDVDLTDWWSVSAFYMYRDNNSTINGLDFWNNQVGVQMKFSY